MASFISLIPIDCKIRAGELLKLLFVNIIHSMALQSITYASAMRTYNNNHHLFLHTIVQHRFYRLSLTYGNSEEIIITHRHTHRFHRRCASVNGSHFSIVWFSLDANRKLLSGGIDTSIFKFTH